MEDISSILPPPPPEFAVDADRGTGSYRLVAAASRCCRNADGRFRFVWAGKPVDDFEGSKVGATAGDEMVRSAISDIRPFVRDAGKVGVDSVSGGVSSRSTVNLVPAGGGVS